MSSRLPLFVQETLDYEKQVRKRRLVRVAYPLDQQISHMFSFLMLGEFIIAHIRPLVNMFAEHLCAHFRRNCTQLLELIAYHPMREGVELEQLTDVHDLRQPEYVTKQLVPSVGAVFVCFHFVSS